MLNIVYPSAAEMYEIAPDLMATSPADYLGLSLFPDEPRRTFEVRWWQKDNAYGLMAMRGVDGKPLYVERQGQSQFVHKPGVYGDFTSITEGELLQRCDPLATDRVLKIDDYVIDSSRLLLSRMKARKEFNTWTLLTTGTLNIPLGPVSTTNGPAGPNVYTVTFPLQTFTATIPWSTTATATPIADIQTVQQKSVGHGTSFGPESTLYVNQVTANSLVNNTNATDFGGRRNAFGATINTIKDVSNFWQGQGLPAVEIYDKGYQNQAVAGPITNSVTQFSKYIPNGKGVLIGRRPGSVALGHWQITMCLNNPDNAPGPYNYVKDCGVGMNAPKETPARLEIHAGFNGGLTIEYPSGICIVNC
jgi:hypothetical protein